MYEVEFQAYNPATKRDKKNIAYAALGIWCYQKLQLFANNPELNWIFHITEITADTWPAYRIKYNEVNIKQESM